MTSKVLKFKVEEGCTVLGLKCLIEFTKGIPLDHQRLVFVDEKLEDERTISDYNIQEECEILLILRLAGC